MSRMRSVLSAASLVALMSAFVPAAASAQCSRADLCTPAVCQQRQNVVHPTCDQPRSCAAIDAGDKVQLRARLTINQQCLAARQNVAQCFSVQDPGHQQVIAAVQAAILVCTQKIAQ